ncbi:hypothetical protein NIES2109_14640 [Nostoc sp. HK-01]|uniref:NADP-dependent oxidoreductase n=1 Tax=Nostoc cycadae WK-1 TaxID=1861711 RepID=A0A2H6LCZ7_9NOSO|nr:hypothetical protein NIES2109_14640 [Nostoc sp. HK-01]GBE91053.1 NADP-dependent oxidoreductase [Nostoc cycadae WK-1]
MLQESTQILRVNSLINLQMYAPVLNSLRQRDWKALIELFDREDSDEIEADINNNLHLRTPEPCWEDDPFDFLREFL